MLLHADYIWKKTAKNKKSSSNQEKEQNPAKNLNICCF